MSSNALDSQGVLLQRGDAASPEAFTTIPETMTVSQGGSGSNEIDVTDLSSTSKEFRMGIQDHGSMTLGLNYIPDNTVHAGLITDRSNQTLRNFRIAFTDSPTSYWAFSAYVMSFDLSIGVDDVIRASVTLRLSGDIAVS